MCDIWKETGKSEISASDLERHLQDIESLSVKWIVLSGGEPLMHSDLFRLCALLHSRNIRVTLLSTGILLERNADRIIGAVDDVIVSLDGPPAVHDRIRRVPGIFALLERGVRALQDLRTGFAVSGRCTIQRVNHRFVCETARAAKRLGLTSISFLAADLTSEAFNRPLVWSADRQAQIALSEPEISVLERELESVAREWAGTGFVLESRQKLERIVRHFRAHIGLCEPVAPRCNAPWVSAVLEADGNVRPCFFHRAIGSTQDRSLLNVLNGPEAIQFRSTLDVANNPVCQRCVCSLYLDTKREAPTKTELLN